MPLRACQLRASKASFWHTPPKLFMFTQLYEMKELTTFLTRISAPSFQPEVADIAKRLLRKVLPPAEYSRLGESACCLLLGALQTIPLGTAAPAISCCICMADEVEMASGRKPIAYMPCLHAFHVKCIEDWLKHGNDICPACTTPVLKNIQKLLRE